MILLGTASGRILAFNSHKKTIEARFGESGHNSSIVSLNYLNELEEHFYFVSRSGQFTRMNLFDAFDLQQYTFTDNQISAAELYPSSQLIFAASTSGKILSLNFSNEDEVQLI